MGGRADLCATARRPQHLLRPEVPSTLSACHPRRGTGPDAGGPLEEELLRLRTTQAHQGREASRPRLRARPGSATDETTGHPRGEPREEALHDPRRRQPPARTGLRETPVHRVGAEPVVGRRLHLLRLFGF